METDQAQEATQSTVSAVVRDDFEARESEAVRGAGSGAVATHGSGDQESYEEGLVARQAAPPHKSADATDAYMGETEAKNHYRKVQSSCQ